MIRITVRQWALAVCVIALVARVEAPVLAATLPVSENGNPIGTITMNVAGNGVSGNFTVTAIDPNTKMPYTLPALAKSLGEDHFNWLQDYTQSKDVTITSLAGNSDNAMNNQATTQNTYKAGATIIDPQSGGQFFGGAGNGQWADRAPWYYDEAPLPNSLKNGGTITDKNGTTWDGDNAYQLSQQTNGSTLSFEDTPNDKNLTLNFSTYLVSVGPGNTYKPLAGFSWSVTFDNNGKATVTLPQMNNKLTPKPFADEINTEINAQGFGKWTVTPEPSALILLGTGLAAVPFGLRRRLQAWRLASAA